MSKKSKWPKRIKIGCLSSVILIVVLSQFVSGCISFSMSDKEVRSYFEEKAEKPESVTYKVGDYQMHYEVLDLNQPATICFIHGTPGSWDAFIQYFTDSTLYDDAVILSPDRPGFGKSSYGKPVASLARQVELMAPMLEKYPAPRILVGHSLGGPIVARMAMDRPDLVDGMVLLAPALAPQLEPEEDWFRVPMRWPIIEGIVPKVFRVSNEELIFLEEELDEMLPLWSGVKAPTIVIQGEADDLVNPGNGPFADSVLVNAPHEIIMLEGQNHFLPWNEYPLVVESVQKMLKVVQKDSLTIASFGIKH